MTNLPYAMLLYTYADSGETERQQWVLEKSCTEIDHALILNIVNNQNVNPRHQYTTTSFLQYRVMRVGVSSG